MKILHPTDFSEASMKALEVVRQLKEPLHAEVILLHTIEAPRSTPIYGDYWNESLNEVVKKGQLEAIETTRRHLERLEPDAEAHLEIGHPFKTILRFAREKDVDLIAMGTHGLDSFMDRILGSITERVIELARRPVVSTRANAEVRPFKHFLVATALAEPSRRALTFAKKIAEATGARLTLMHSIEPIPEPPLPIHMPDPAAADVRQQYVEQVAKDLQTLASEFGAQPLLKEAKPVDAVCQVVPELDIDAVFIGRSRQRRFMGSVTREILERAAVPVFVHP